MLPKMQIYDVTNPQGFICQSKADVKCKHNNNNNNFIHPLFKLNQIKLQWH